MNLCIFKGRLTAKPELQVTPEATEYCKFSVAVDRYNGKGKERTADFVPCTAWRQTAAFICQYFDKGQEILVQGEMHFDKYEKDGETRTYASLLVNKAEFCGGRALGGEQGSNTPPIQNASQSENFTAVASDDDLPF